MADKIQIRRDTAANWTSANPILAQGEEGYELDTKLRKVGDGVTPWNSLAYDAGGAVPEAPNDGTKYVRQNLLWVPETDSVTDHGALSGLGDDDHPQYLNESRHDGLPQDNPHGVTKAQVGLGNVDNTSDFDKPISTATQAALDLKVDAAPRGWIQFSSTGSQTFSFNQRIQLDLTPGFSILQPNAPAGASNWWNTTTQKFQPPTVGDFFILRLTADVTANQGDKQITFDLDIGGTQGIIWETTIRTPKSGGQLRKYALSIPVFTLGTFVANGGSFNARFDTSGTVANVQVLIYRGFAA